MHSVFKLKNIKKMINQIFFSYFYFPGIEFYNPVGLIRIGRKRSREMKQLEDVSAALGLSLNKICDQQKMDTL